MKAVFLFFSLFLVLSSSIVNAWEKVSLPSQTEVVKEEEMTLNGQETKSLVCRTNLSVKEVKAFYLRFLPSLGWEEDCPECNQQTTENMRLKFSKGNDKIAIMCRPSRAEKGKNEIVIVMSKAKSELAETLEMGGKDAPGQDPDFAPRYPRSQRVFSMEHREFKKATFNYYSADSIKEIGDFFRENMGNYGWSLFQELDLQNLPSQLDSIIKDNIPKGITLFYKGKRGQCIVSLIEHPKEKGASIIGIKYNGK